MLAKAGNDLANILATLYTNFASDLKIGPPSQFFENFILFYLKMVTKFPNLTVVFDVLRITFLAIFCFFAYMALINSISTWLTCRRVAGEEAFKLDFVSSDACMHIPNWYQGHSATGMGP